MPPASSPSSPHSDQWIPSLHERILIDLLLSLACLRRSELLQFTSSLVNVDEFYLVVQVHFAQHPRALIGLLDKVDIRLRPQPDLRLLDVGKLDTIAEAEDFLKQYYT